MASTHLTVKSSGGGDYTTIQAAVNASSSGSAGDYSTITILDSANYNERVTISAHQYLRLTAAAGQTPRIYYSVNPLTISGTADYIEIIGADDSHRLVIELASGATGYQCVYVSSATANFKCQHVAFKQSGVGGYAWANGTAGLICTGEWRFEDCNIAGPSSTTNVLRAGSGGVVNLQVHRCDFTSGTIADAFARTNRLGITMNRCKVVAPALFYAYGGSGIIPASKWSITNNIFIGGTDGAGMLELLDAWGTPPNANVFNNTFYRDGPAGATIGIRVDTPVTTNLSIQNNGIIGYNYGVYSVNNLSIQNNGFWSNTNKYNAAKVTSTSEQTGDPLLTNPAGGNFIPQVGSPWLDTGAAVSLTEDCVGHARPLYGGAGLLYDIGAYEMDFSPPDLTAAVPDGKNTIYATFSEAVSGADLEDASKWTVTCPFGGTAVTVTDVVCNDGINATLTVTPMTGDTLYRVTCPATLQDSFGNLMGTTTADFVTPIWGESESGNPWAVAGDGLTVDLVNGPFELVPWDVSADHISLEQAVWMSLFSDRRADDDDLLPDGKGDLAYRGGWWADYYADDQFGSKLWLLVREPLNDETILKAKQYASEALDWMITSGVAARIDVEAERQGTNRLALRVVIYKQDGSTKVLNYDDLWAAYK